MATKHDYLKARFAFIRQDFDGVFGRLTDADLPWSPGPGMRSIADMLLEIANKERETIAWLQTGVWPDGEPDTFDVETVTLEGVRGAMDSLRVQTYAYIDSFSEEELDELIHNPETWWETMRIPDCPRSEVIRNIAVHEWYHTAQLVIYLWMRGDDPYNYPPQP